MKQPYKYAATMLALCLVAGLSMPVFAETTDASSGSNAPSSEAHYDHIVASEQATPISDNQAATDQTDLGTSKPAEHPNGDETAHWQGQAKTFLNELKQHPRSNDERQKACEVRQHGLETKLTNLKTNAKKYDQKVSEVFTKVVAYHDANTVTVSNWDQLLTAAKNTQATAQTSVDTLQGLSATLDCTNPNVAQTVATFKAGAEQTRTDLKAYKTAVINLITALEQAKGDKQS